MKKAFKTQKGLTLTELIAVIAIITILSSVAIVSYTSFIKKSAVSTDMLLVNRLNLILDDYQPNAAMDDDFIVKLIKNEFNNDVRIETERYGMNIYFNKNSNKFEILSNQDAQKLDLKALDYYLNSIIFKINKSYYKIYDDLKITDVDEKLKLYYQNGALYLTIYADHNSQKIKGPQVIDLSEIITIENNSISYSVKEIDLVENIPHEKNVNYVLYGDKLEIFTPGKYRITYSCDGAIGEIDLYAKNIYLSLEPQISAGKVKYTVQKYDKSISIKLKNITNGITVSDYDRQFFYYNSLPLSETPEHMNSITIILKLGDSIIEIPMSTDEEEYSYTFEDIDPNAYDSIIITYRYQALNGMYYYSNEQEELLKESTP